MLEYCKVMQPVAQALDILQAETKCYMGILLPTIVSLKKQLIKLREVVKITTPLVDALLAGIQTRYAACMNRDDLILASVTHPQFRLRWIEDLAAKDRARQMLQRAIRTENEKAVVPVPETDDKTATDDGFFTFDDCGESNSHTTILAEMDMYLGDTSREVTCLTKFPTVKILFLRYNTGLPSSAPVERMFSLGGQILTARRNRLSDEHFEMQLLLRANKDLHL